MDNYPSHLAPAFDEGGGVVTPFKEWWERVSEHFPTVPEDVAEQWLHRHWHYSPYSWMRSADYRFKLVSWGTSRLNEISSSTDDWDYEKSIAHGSYLVTDAGDLWLVRYMVDNQNAPRPIIVLDNRDGSLSAEDPYGYSGYPHGYIIVEGHTRFSLAAYLSSICRLSSSIDAWLMTKVSQEVS